jgi:hypothetical protein
VHASVLHFGLDGGSRQIGQRRSIGSDLLKFTVSHFGVEAFKSAGFVVRQVHGLKMIAPWGGWNEPGVEGT